MIVEMRTAVVTGASGGLGRALSLELSRRGYTLALADMDRESVVSLSREIVASGGSAKSFSLDVTDPEGWQSLRNSLRSEWSRLDVLVNAAGCLTAGELHKSEWDAWSRVVNVNLLGTALGCHTFAEWLIESGMDSVTDRTTRVVNVASIAGYLPLTWGSAYTASKAGVIGLSESLQAEWQPRGVKVTIVCPGFFRSGLLKHGSFSDELVQRVARLFFDQATVTAEDVATAAVDGMERGRLYVVLPWKARWLRRWKRLAPASLIRLSSRRAHGVRAALRREMKAGDSNENR